MTKGLSPPFRIKMSDRLGVESLSLGAGDMQLCSNADEEQLE